MDPALLDRAEIQIRARAQALAARFESRWGPFTRSLAGHPKTALAIGFGVGIAIGTAAGRWVLGMVLGLIF